MRFKTIAKYLGWSALTLSLAACYVEVDEGHDDAWETPAVRDVYLPGGMPDDFDGTERSCRIYDYNDGFRQDWYCWERENYSYRTQCEYGECKGIKVFAHYMLTEDLGEGHTLHVEAFDNPTFHGAPVGSTRITGFQARTGKWDETEIFLAPGEYYMRAYLTTESDERAPYQFGDMDLVADKPVGVFGALSGAEKVVVRDYASDPYAEPVHIYLDKLFKKPGEEPLTEAYLRLSMEIAEGKTAPDGKLVKIQLFEDDDFGAQPIKDMTMASELFLISGREGRGEFVSESLPVGKFFLVVFVDEDGNGYRDPEELQAIHSAYGEPRLLNIQEKRTESVSLTLKPAVDGGDTPDNPDAPDQDPGEGDDD